MLPHVNLLFPLLLLTRRQYTTNSGKQKPLTRSLANIRHLFHHLAIYPLHPGLLSGGAELATPGATENREVRARSAKLLHLAVKRYRPFSSII